MTYGTFFTLILAITIALTRIAGVKDVLFKDAAHTFVTVMFANTYWCGRKTPLGRFYLAIAVCLSIVELIVFTLSRFYS